MTPKRTAPPVVRRLTVRPAAPPLPPLPPVDVPVEVVVVPVAGLLVPEVVLGVPPVPVVVVVFWPLGDVVVVEFVAKGQSQHTKLKKGGRTYNRSEERRVGKECW